MMAAATCLLWGKWTPHYKSRIRNNGTLDHGGSIIRAINVQAEGTRSLPRNACGCIRLHTVHLHTMMDDVARKEVVVTVMSQQRSWVTE